MSEHIRAQDSAGNDYEVSDDHTEGRRVGTEEWKPLAQLRFEVGPLTLSPQKEVDDA
jgi:hypothetical protein